MSADRTVERIVFLGAGKMAQALAQGLGRVKSPVPLAFYSPTQTRAQALASEFKAEHLQSLSQLRSGDCVVLACRPQNFSELASELRSLKNPPVHFVSVMAAISRESVQAALPFAKEIVRLMPTLNCAHAPAPAVIYPMDRGPWAQWVQSLGPLLDVADEEQFHFATCLVGSFPGVFAEVVVWMMEQGQAHGLAPDAMLAALASNFKAFGMGLELLGSAVDTSGISSNDSVASVKNFRDQVASHKGITASILDGLGALRVQELWGKSFERGVDRSRELSKT